jgi:hypothetical protein
MELCASHKLFPRHSFQSANDSLRYCYRQKDGTSNEREREVDDGISHNKLSFMKFYY